MFTSVSHFSVLQVVAACDSWQRGSSALWTGQQLDQLHSPQDSPETAGSVSNTHASLSTELPGQALSPPPFWLLDMKQDLDSAHPGVFPLPLSSMAALLARSKGGRAGGEDSGAMSGAPDDVWLCFSDPSNLPDNPGWPLRNLLLLAMAHWDIRHVTVSF